MKVVVILPTYNERENIIALLDDLHSATRGVRQHRIEYLIADDNSPDGTIDVVDGYRRTHTDVHLITGEKQGLGRALLRGMAYAVKTLGADILMQMDADHSHDPMVLPAFLNAIDGGADFVVGSRYIRGGSIPDNWALHRKIFSIAGNAVVRYGLGFPDVHDWTGGYRAHRTRFYTALRNELTKYNGYVFQIAFLHKAILHGARVVEVPIRFTDRRFGRSKIAPSEYIRNVLGYVASQRLNSIMTGPFGKFLVVGTIGFVINTVVLEGAVALGFHPTIGSIGGAELAIVSNFILNNAWTFHARKITGALTAKKFLQFNATSLGAVVIQASSVGFGTYAFGIAAYRLFYILGVAVGLVWNYTMYSRVIWKKPAGSVRRKDRE
jgi:dolichol-phosphate mannosyltransferase